MSYRPTKDQIVSRMEIGCEYVTVDLRELLDDEYWPGAPSLISTSKRVMRKPLVQAAPRRTGGSDLVYIRIA